MAISGQHLGIHHLHNLFRQPLLGFVRDGSGKLLGWGEKGIFSNRALALGRYLLDENPDWHQSVFFSLAEHVDGLLESAGNLAEARNVIFVMLNGIQWHGVRKI